MVSVWEWEWELASPWLSMSVSAIAPAGEIADVELVCGGVRLVARITAASAKRLELAEGIPAWAVIKSVTVDRNA